MVSLSYGSELRHSPKTGAALMKSYLSKSVWHCAHWETVETHTLLMI